METKPIYAPEGKWKVSWETKTGRSTKKSAVLIRLKPWGNRVPGEALPSPASVPNGRKEIAIESPEDGTVSQMVEDGCVVSDHEMLGTIKFCRHMMRIGSLCTICGASVGPMQQDAHGSKSRSDENSIDEGFSRVTIPGGSTLWLNQKAAAAYSSDKLARLRGEKKLLLVLDLDNTLLHATPDPAAASRLSADVHHFSLDGVPGLQHVKIRPFLPEFLSRASKSFEMSVYTHGTRAYAEAVLKRIDPTDALFRRRIVSASDTNDRVAKCLTRILPCGTDMVLIVDDRDDVWRGPQGNNLILVRPYHFWGSNLFPMYAAPVELQTENDPQLQRVLSVAEDVHRRFYEHGGEGAHAATILGNITNKVLSGVCIVFSGVIPINGVGGGEGSRLISFARRLGAKIADRVGPGVTHVVAAHMGTEKTSLALKTPGCVVVHVNWLFFCMWHLRREDEKLFPLTSSSSRSSAFSSRKRSPTPSTSALNGGRPSSKAKCSGEDDTNSTSGSSLGSDMEALGAEVSAGLVEEAAGNRAAEGCKT